ncbi:MAG: acyl-CoA dehydrogenase domain protein [Solirubrobacteraceae bacterium]|nr:acyl-CoA dehydrogenase domain protein [Solirubrobacteraceae bacterium]
MEAVEAFRAPARAWLGANLPRAGEGEREATSEGRVRRAQALQQQIFDAGSAGLTWPKEYGGQELGVEHLQAYAEELRGFENPYHAPSVSLGVIGPTILEHGTQEQKSRRLPARCAARRCGCTTCRSPRAARTWPGSSPPPCATVTSG